MTNQHSAPVERTPSPPPNHGSPLFIVQNFVSDDRYIYYGDDYRKNSDLRPAYLAASREGTPLLFTSEESALEWMLDNDCLSFEQQRDAFHRELDAEHESRQQEYKAAVTRYQADLRQYEADCVFV